MGFRKSLGCSEEGTRLEHGGREYFRVGRFGWRGHSVLKLGLFDYRLHKRER